MGTNFGTVPQDCQRATQVARATEAARRLEGALRMSSEGSPIDRALNGFFGRLALEGKELDGPAELEAYRRIWFKRHHYRIVVWPDGHLEFYVDGVRHGRAYDQEIKVICIMLDRLTASIP